MSPNYTNIHALSILNRYENHPDDLDDLQAAQVKKTVEVTVEFEDLKNYILPVTGFCETLLCKKMINLKNGLGEMRKRCRPCVVRFYKVSKLKSTEEYYLRLLQLYMPWRQESGKKGNV